jgi:Zn-dependent peptidase ImmA (M78 family)/transcriptional regulator with XRE-family HTH domain
VKSATSTFGQRVAKERAQRGWTLRQLAGLSGLPYARIHRIETDPAREITFLDAVRLADAFGIPAAWLVNGSQIKDRLAAAARSSTEAEIGEAIDAVLPVLELAAQLDELDELDELDDGAASRPVSVEQPRHRTSPREWGREQAERVRTDWGVPSGPVHDLARPIEAGSGAMVVVAAFPEGVDGLALTDPQTGNSLLAVGETVHWERQRFTLAHELGHLVAGDRVVEAVTPTSSSPTETAASEFARNFLVPLADLRNRAAARTEPWDELAVATLAWEYRVSPAVMAIQLRRANLAADSLVTRVSQVSANTWSMLGGWQPERHSLTAGSEARRVPPALVARALQAWTRALIPTATIARLLAEDTTAVEQRLHELGVQRDASLLATV